MVISSVKLALSPCICHLLWYVHRNTASCLFGQILGAGVPVVAAVRDIQNWGCDEHYTVSINNSLACSPRSNVV